MRSEERRLCIGSWCRVAAIGALAALTVFLLVGYYFFEPIRLAEFWPSSTTAATEPTSIECLAELTMPDVELFMPLQTNKTGLFELENWFLPSLALFWPKIAQPKLLILTDGEDGGEQLIAQRAIETAVSIFGKELKVRNATTFAPFPMSARLDRPQWLKFWADNFTDAEFVAFVDSDAVFVTRVTRRDLFIDDKPIVRSVHGNPKELSGFWFKVPGGTFNATGFKEPFNCMTYFPVIVKTEHLKAIRRFLTERTGRRTFDEAIADILRRDFFSEFNVICTLLWYHFRDDYFWIVTFDRALWKVRAPGQASDLVEAEIGDDLLERTRPHVAIHWTYQQLEMDHTVHKLRDIFRQGVCYSLTAPERRPNFCKPIANRTKTTNKFEFSFEVDNFSHAPGALDAHLKRIAANEKCPHPWNAQILASLE